MATRFVPIDRDRPLLLPSNLRDWVSADPLVHFVVIKRTPGSAAGFPEFDLQHCLRKT